MLNASTRHQNAVQHTKTIAYSYHIYFPLHVFSLQLQMKTKTVLKPIIFQPNNASSHALKKHFGFDGNFRCDTPNILRAALNANLCTLTGKRCLWKWFFPFASCARAHHNERRCWARISLVAVLFLCRQAQCVRRYCLCELPPCTQSNKFSAYK